MAQEPAGRLDALDILRGAAVVGMFLATLQGDWGHVYGAFRHADWNGCTPTDIVFPAFLVSTGVTVGLSFDRANADAVGRARFAQRAAQRAFLLVLLGVALEVTYNLAISAGAQFPGRGGLGALRLPGVLQRIGLCYALACLLARLTAGRAPDGARTLRPAVLAGVTGAGLLAYGLLLLDAPVPGFGAGRLDAVGSWPAYLDRLVFTPAHLWPLATAHPGGPVTYDPEGLLTTLPSTADVLVGVLAGWTWRRRPERAALLTLGGGLVLVAAGLLLDPVVAVNKRLWTPSFALLGSGWSVVGLAGFALALRRPGLGRLCLPLRVLGTNAILAFGVATAISRASGFAWLPEGGGRVTPQVFGDHLVLRILPDPYLASLACAAGMTALITLVLWPLHRRGLHLRL